jgi:hypothetical protein
MIRVIVRSPRPGLTVALSVVFGPLSNLVSALVEFKYRFVRLTFSTVVCTFNRKMQLAIRSLSHMKRFCLIYSPGLYIVALLGLDNLLMIQYRNVTVAYVKR